MNIRHLSPRLETTPLATDCERPHARLARAFTTLSLVSLSMAGCGGQLPDLRPTVTKTITTDPTPQPTVTITETVTPTATPSPTESVMQSRIVELSEDDIKEMTGITLRPDIKGCAKPEDLRIVTVPYRDKRGETQQGELVVNEQIASDVQRMWVRIYDEVPDFRFTGIQRPEKVVNGPLEGSEVDATMMKLDLTSAFNCRKIAGSSTISQHGLGRAIDINPLTNPAVTPGMATKVAPGKKRTFDPPTAEAGFDTPQPAFALRENMYPASDVLKIADEENFAWGGNWSTSITDFQHFEQKS